MLPLFAEAGTDTSIEKSDDEVIVPLTLSNHTSRSEDVAENPDPEMTIFEPAYDCLTSTLVMRGVCARETPDNNVNNIVDANLIRVIRAPLVTRLL
jgi:hypothetical protein